MIAQRLVRRCMPKIIPFRYYSKCEKDPPPVVACDVLTDMECRYNKFKETESCSLLKKHLTNPIFVKINRRLTPTFRSSLLDVIQSGMCNTCSDIGVFAPDPEAYTTFGELLNNIIRDYHGLVDAKPHPRTCYGYGTDFPDVDPERKFVISTSISCRRNIKGFPFTPRMTRCHFTTLQNLIVEALRNLCGQHRGKYMPLFEMDPCVQHTLTKQKLIFSNEDDVQEAANILRFWPLGRGLFINRRKTFIVWINQEDHIRVIAKDEGGDIGKAYELMIIGIESLAHQLKFAHDSRLGYLTTDPANLGSGITATVRMKLPTLIGNRTLMSGLVKQFGLKITKTEICDVYDISNKYRMGMTEYNMMTQFHKGIDHIVQLECVAEATRMKKPGGSKRDHCCNNVAAEEEEPKIKPCPSSEKKYNSSRCNKQDYPTDDCCDCSKTDKEE